MIKNVTFFKDGEIVKKQKVDIKDKDVFISDIDHENGTENVYLISRDGDKAVLFLKQKHEKI